MFGQHHPQRQEGRHRNELVSGARHCHRRQVGTGIIVGVAGAILTGGGAVFWMWVSLVFGHGRTIYAEATLAQETRIVELDGTIKGGPVYYITTAFKGKFGKFLAGFFAVAITLALGFMGCMVQSNSIGATVETAFGIPSWVVGIVLIVICASSSSAACSALRP